MRILLLKSEGHIVVPRTCSYDDEISVRNASKFANEPQMQRFSSRILFSLVGFLKRKILYVSHMQTAHIQEVKWSRHVKRNKWTLGVSRSWWNILWMCFYRIWCDEIVTCAVLSCLGAWRFYHKPHSCRWRHHGGYVRESLNCRPISTLRSINSLVKYCRLPL